MSTVNWTKRCQEFAGGKPIPKSLIIQAASQIRMKGPHTSVIEEAMLYGFDLVNWAILPEQTAQGLAWIRTPRILRLFPEAQQATIQAFDHFTFSGLLIAPRAYGYFNAHPVYRVHGTDGSWFDYVCYGGPYSGGSGGVEVLDCGRGGK